MHRILSILLAVVLTVSSIDLTAFAKTTTGSIMEESWEDSSAEGWNYSAPDHTYTLASLSGNEAEEESLSGNGTEAGSHSGNETEGGAAAEEGNSFENIAEEGEEGGSLSGNETGAGSLSGNETEAGSLSGNEMEGGAADEESNSSENIGEEGTEGGSLSGNETEEEAADEENNPSENIGEEETEGGSLSGNETEAGGLTGEVSGNDLPVDSNSDTEEDGDASQEEMGYRVSAPVSDISQGKMINEDTVIRLSSATLDAKIYYTTDGSDPSLTGEGSSARLYTDGIKAVKVMRDSDDSTIQEKVVTIRAYARKEGRVDSRAVEFTYVVESEQTRWGDIRQEDRKLYTTADMPEGDASLVPSGMWVAGIRQEGYTYSGEKITFLPDTENELRVYEGKKLLELNKDYKISYKNNKNVYQLTEGDADYNAAKAPTVTLTGKGNYSGSIIKTFVIKPADLSALNSDGSAMFEAPSITLAYNGQVQKGTTKVTYTNANGKTIALKANKDFTYQYPGTDDTAKDYDSSAFREARENPYLIRIEGKGNYTGTLTVEEWITSSILISKVKVSSIPAQPYKKGTPAKPKVTLQYGGNTLTEYDEAAGTGDYSLQYQNNDKPGTASVIITGKGKYAGTRTVTFKINGKDIRKAKMEGFQSSFIYTGDEIKQDKVKFSDESAQGTGKVGPDLQENEHYTVEYTKNRAAGTATVIYTGIPENGWTGRIKKTFKITAYDLKADSEKRITVTDSRGEKYPQSLSYVKGGTRPLPVVKYTSPGGQEYILVEGVDYKLSYLNNKAVNDGTNTAKLPTIKITGKGNFKGSRQQETFRITGSDISGLTITASDVVYQNKAGKFTTSVVITDSDGSKLKAGKDYEKTFNYYYDETVKLSDGSKREAGTEVLAGDIVPAGTVLRVEVTGKGLYAGNSSAPATISGLYRIVTASLDKASIKVNKQYYTGKEVRPNKSQIVITINKKVLRPEDYEILSYTNNINKGKAKITLKGVGNYGGTKTVNFEIANKSMYYMISFNANGATSGSMKDMRIHYGKSYELTKNAYKRTGYTFLGWNTDSDGSGVDAEGKVILYADKASNPVEIGKEDIGKTLILYAQWELTRYKITYNLNGGKNHEANPDTYTVEEEVVFKDPMKEGYTFMGWYTDSGFSESKKITSISRGSAGDKVLYAKWRPTVISEVEAPAEGEYLNVYDYGAVPDDDKDDTDAIEKAVWQASANADSGGINTVYVPAGTYIITAGDADWDGDPGISLKSNVNLIMDNGAILEVAGSSYGSYCVISAKNVANITIQGGQIKGERYRHSGTGGESGHGIALYGATNINISNVSISSNWGDGIYVGTQRVRQEDGSQLSVGCDTININGCEIYDNRRSNISLTDGDNVTIDHCYIADAHGTAPQCGICIEPNSNSSGDRICRNITIKDTTIDAYKNKNAPEYMCFMTHHNPYVSGYTTADGIYFINCRLNGYVGNYSGNNLNIDANTVINGTFDNLR